jgi:hypothetical protein
MSLDYLGQMIVTSLSVIPAGLYFLLMVESVDGLRAYRNRFLMDENVLDKMNNAATVGLVGYMIFIFSVPFIDWLFGTMFDITVTQAVTQFNVWLQISMLVILGIMNITMAYLGLQK